ncbi:MAG: hypothetical protein ABJZ55_11655 [Fuerstiella sp.]
MKCTTLLSLGTILAIFGCEKLPELPINGKSEPIAETEQVSDSAAKIPETPVVPPTPEQVIAAFQTMKTTDVAESDILELASIESGLDQIEELDLKGSRLTPASMAALAKFTGLKKLDLSSAAFGGGNLQAISTLPALEWLDLSRTSTNNLNMQSVAKIKGLKVLSLAQTVVNDEGLGLLTELSALEELNVSGTETVGLYLAALGKDGAKAPLKILNASHTRVGTQGFRFVNQFPLVQLHVSKAMVTDLSMEGLRGCTELTDFTLSQNRITDKSAKWILISKALQNLDLTRNTAITDNTLKRLATLRDLSQLNLTKTSCSVKAAKDLKKRLPNCTVRIAEQTL